MEVLVNDEEGDEFIYWVALAGKPKDEDEYDLSIELAIAFHNNKDLSPASIVNAEAMEPFSRNESEFTFVK
jgi:hypothetical protein